MNKYKLIRIAAGIVFAVSFCCWGYTKLLYLDADVSYRDLEKRMVTVTEAAQAENDGGTESPAEDEPFLEIDHEHLLDENRDYIGWLSACGNKISYPIVIGRDNDEYLHHTFFREKNFVGSIFADYRCAPDLNDFQTVLYGHSMKDWTMFRALVQYTDREYAQQYPYFYIYTPEGRRKYKVFAVYDVNGRELAAAPGETEQQERENFISEVMKKSLYSLDTVPTADDRIVSLITCDVRDDSKRVAVNGVEVN